MKKIIKTQNTFDLGSYCIDFFSLSSGEGAGVGESFGKRASASRGA